VATRRRFNPGFKRQVVEEWIAGAGTLAQLSRRYEVCPNLVRRWKQQYGDGALADPESACGGQDRQQRIRELEQMVGKLTMENALLKRAVAWTAQRRKEALSPITGPNSARSQGGAN